VPLAEEVNAIALQGLSTNEVEVTRRAVLSMVRNLANDEEDRVAGRAPAIEPPVVARPG
jgi:hypothetical protein